LQIIDVYFQSSFIPSDLLLVFDSFYGNGKRKQVKALNKNEKKKLHHVNDEQLFELTDFIQHAWLKNAENAGDIQAVNRLVAWSMTNRLEMDPQTDESNRGNEVTDIYISAQFLNSTLKYPANFVHLSKVELVS
ncbi:hypothetical protein OESDEN_19391, partial [Oesophagostomum dentatum]